MALTILGTSTDRCVVCNPPPGDASQVFAAGVALGNQLAVGRINAVMCRECVERVQSLAHLFVKAASTPPVEPAPSGAN